MAAESLSAYEFLTNSMHIDLSAVTQCGGHSVARTHRPKTAPVGVAIMSKMKAMILESVSGKTGIYSGSGTILSNSKVLTNCAAVSLIKRERKIQGIYIEYKQFLICIRTTCIILATGGYAGDGATADSLIRENAPHLVELPTTNGDFAKGEGIKMARSIGAIAKDLDQIQVHPTGFIDPSNRDAKTKFLCPELLRGVGAILLDPSGKRFCNELGLRDYITQQIFASCPNRVARVLFPQQSAELFGPTLSFYLKKGFIKSFGKLADFANNYGIPLGALQETLSDYNKCAKGEKSDDFGKMQFPVVIPTGSDAVYYGCEVTPAVHYTMGGIKVDENCAVLCKDEKDSECIFGGLYAVGEVSAGIHGVNRLVGNSLLECVVFGKRAGQAAVEFCEIKSKL